MNKIFKIVFSGLLIAVSAGMLISYLLSSQQPREFEIPLDERGENGYVTAVLNCNFPTVPDKVSGLKVVRHYYTEDEAIAIARNIFNIAGELEVRNISSLDLTEVTNQKENVDLFYGGAIEYFILDYNPINTPNLPSSEQAKKIADNLLAKLEKLRSPLLQIVYQSVGPGRWFGASNEDLCVVELNVNYELRYADMPIIGGSDIVVSIGDQGRLVGFRGCWRNVELGDDVSITVTPEQALTKLGSNLGLKGVNPKKLIIDNIKLGYWAEAVSERQDELLPIYVFKGTVITENNEEIPWQTHLPATATNPS